MTFELTEDQKMMQEMAREFAERELQPLAAEMDQSGEYNLELLAKLGEAGFTALNVPEEYGGAGLDLSCKAIAIEELAKQCASTAEIISVHSLVNELFIKNGNDAQKQKYLTAAAMGKIGAFAITEPDTGSDIASVKTSAILSEENYIINGRKSFISNVGKNIGDYIVVIVTTNPSLGRNGLSAIVVDRGTKGLTIGRTEDKMGIRAADVSELIFENCRVPQENLIGTAGEGFKIALSALESGRVGMAAQSVGLAEAAIEMSIQYMKKRAQFGVNISQYQGLRWYIAEMATRTEAAKALLYEACDAVQRNQSPQKFVSMCKYFAAENAIYVANKAVQIHGGYGFIKEYPIERIYRDARIAPIYEGTSEIQKNIIAKQIFNASQSGPDVL